MIFFPGDSQILYHFPGDVAVKNPPANVGDTDMQASSLAREDPLE